MFERVGEKIKGWAIIVFTLMMIASFVLAIVSWATIEDGEPYYVIGGFLYVIIGPLSAWLSSLILYGFGELIEESKAARKMLQIQVTGNNKDGINVTNFEEQLENIEKKENNLFSDEIVSFK